MRLTVLGSGTLVPDDDRRSACHLVEVAGARVLLDLGFGAVHGFDRRGVTWSGLTHLAISHFHTDHVGDVAPLLFTLKYGIRPPRETPLVVLGPPGLTAFLDALAAAHGSFVTDPGFPLTVVELSRTGRWQDPDGRFSLACHPTPHTDASVAWRVEAEDGTVGYTGDTGPSEDVAAFLAGVDVLLAECSLPDPPEMDLHLSPWGVAELGRTANPRLLVVTHVYPMLPLGEVVGRVRAAGFQGRTVLATDGMRIGVRGGTVQVVE